MTAAGERSTRALDHCLELPGRRICGDPSFTASMFDRCVEKLEASGDRNDFRERSAAARCRCPANRQRQPHAENSLAGEPAAVVSRTRPMMARIVIGAKIRVSQQYPQKRPYHRICEAAYIADPLCSR